MLNETVGDFDAEKEIVITMVDLLVDAIIGVGFPTMGIGVIAEREKIAHFMTSRDGTPSWRWDSKKLSALSEEKLQALYHNLKVAQYGG